MLHSLSRHLAIITFSIYLGMIFFQPLDKVNSDPPSGLGRVVVVAPMLVGLYAGDRFLAANFEAIRLSATGMDSDRADTGYLIRAQQEVAILNPCHEDNYYLANGLLTLGGAVEVGNKILKAAMECRSWDGVPAFFYGINLAFFNHDIDGAVKSIKVSASRWPENYAALNKLAVMLKAESYSDERLALIYIKSQRDESRDAVLRGMLEKRMLRLQGLLDLRSAQRLYEKEHGVLVSLNQLVEYGYLSELPNDPLGIGYALRKGRIDLKKLNFEGFEG